MNSFIHYFSQAFQCTVKVKGKIVCNIFAERCPVITLANDIYGVTYSREPVDGQYLVNTNVTVECINGFEQTGSSLRTCQPSGNWDGTTPTCEGNEMSMSKLFNL